MALVALDDLRAMRANLQSSRLDLVARARARGQSNLTAADDRQFVELSAQLIECDERIADLEADEQRTANASRTFGAVGFDNARVTRDGSMVYRQGGEHSYWRDQASALLRGDFEARSRLERHAHEASNAIAAGDYGFERRDLTRTDGSAGYAVPPLWLMQDYVTLARAGRPTANLVRREPLPPGTDSINIPKLATGVTVSVQTADNQAVSETDMTDTSLSGPVITIAGQQDVAIQVLEQSPIAFDQVIFGDLIAAYATQLDLQVLNGIGSAGQLRGILQTASINSVTYTSTSPTAGALFGHLADAVQQIHTGRFLPPTHIVLHPRRWAALLAATDTAGRPLVVPNAGGPYNALGNADAPASEGIVGTVQGLPVVVDPNIGTTYGAGTNEDIVIVMRSADCLLFEGPVNTRVLPDVGSATLTVRLQTWGYASFLAGRYPQSISKVSGTGLTTPSYG